MQEQTENQAGELMQEQTENQAGELTQEQMNEQKGEQTENQAEKQTTLLDVCCGTGTIGMVMARVRPSDIYRGNHVRSIFTASCVCFSTQRR